MIQKARAIIPFDTQIVAGQEVRDSINDYTDFTVDELVSNYNLNSDNKIFDTNYRTTTGARIGAFDFDVPNQNKYVVVKNVYEVCEVSKVSKNPMQVNEDTTISEVVASKYFKKGGDQTTQQWLDAVCSQENNCVSNDYEYVISCGQKHENTGDDLQGTTTWMIDPNERAWLATNLNSLLPGNNNGYIATSDTQSVSFSSGGFDRLVSASKYGDTPDRKMIAQSRIVDVFVLKYGENGRYLGPGEGCSSTGEAGGGGGSE